MSFDTMLRALVSKGYFPSELPPVFTTIDFGAHVSELLEEWKRAGIFKIQTAGKVPGTKMPKRGSYTYKLNSADVELISKPKRGYERRDISIVHPIPQALLCFELISNWKTVQKWLCRQMYSLDKIHVGHSFTRSIRGVNFDLHRAKKGLY